MPMKIKRNITVLVMEHVALKSALNENEIYIFFIIDKFYSFFPSHEYIIMH